MTDQYRGGMIQLRIAALALGALSVTMLTAISTASQGRDLRASLEAAGSNRAELERAIKDAPDGERDAMRWLVAHMPTGDLRTLSATFLLDNSREAFAAWRGAPWKERVSLAMFEDSILPYACIDEPRDEWRTLLRERCLKLIEGKTSPGAAAVALNQKLFPLVGVKYSTKRKRADQSPRETIDSGLASCTGLSILLIDACRSVGIPARFVGTPLWIDGSGNHSWVEVWDDGWHFTGAAEPSGDDLDKAWFADRAATARRNEPKHAIYAVTWNDSPTEFPPAWREPGEPDDGAVRAVNVTDRYVNATVVVPEGMGRLRLRVSDDNGRVARTVTVIDAGGAVLLEGQSHDEGFDSNDHLTAIVPLGKEVTIRAGGSAPTRVTPLKDSEIVDLSVPGSRGALDALEKFLATHSPAEAANEPFAHVPLSKSDADAALALLWTRHVALERGVRTAELESGEIEVGGVSMPIWFTSYGKAPEAGHSLFISMHGGGGAPKEVNDKQWKNQQKLYEPAEGIYVAPRAPTDTWNLWHQEHIDPLFARLIEDMIIVKGVDPNRIYLTGYSAGGDGVYQLAPRMSDHFAAVAMMAGHPNETKPDGLRNLPFSLHMGANDTPFDRNKVAKEWGLMLDELSAKDAGGYPHLVEIHEGKSHWMDREDASAIAWMAGHRRATRPDRVVWLQDDVTHTTFYWLRVEDPKERTKVVVTRSGQTIDIAEAQGVPTLSIRLDDSMCDLDKPVRVTQGNKVLFEGTVPRTIATLTKTMADRGDPSMCFPAQVKVSLTP